MGAVNEGMRSRNGEIVGVIHHIFVQVKGDDALIKDMIVTQGDNLHERKAKLFEQVAMTDCDDDLSEHLVD